MEQEEEEEVGRGSGLKSRGFFNLVVAGTALKTDLGRSESEDIALKPHHCHVCVCKLARRSAPVTY